MQKKGERVREMLRRNGLKYDWLINNLKEKEIKTEKTELSSVLHGVRKGPKAESIIDASLEILEQYEQVFAKELEETPKDMTA